METYDICITAVPTDSDTARTLADSLRRYRLPGGVTAEPGRERRSVTLDLSGSPLDDEVRAQLDESRFLILLCSPEIRSHRGILDPVESFPENFSERKLVRHIMPDKSVVEREENIEPIAADLRGDSPARRRAALRYETVRITAQVLGLHPDALEQRHRARRKRAIAVALSFAAAVTLTAAGIFLRLGLIAKKEGDIAQEQTRLSAEIATRTMKELPALFEGDEQAIKKVLSELAENALRYSLSKAEFTLKKKGDRIIILQTNDTDLSNGSVDEIFDRFTTLGNAKDKNTAGLGLSYVKDIVKAHNGRVSAKVANGIFTLEIAL